MSWENNPLERLGILDHDIPVSYYCSKGRNTLAQPLDI